MHQFPIGPLHEDATKLIDELYSTEEPNTLLVEHVLVGLTSLAQTKITDHVMLPMNLLRANLQDTHRALCNFFVTEALGMDEDEPFTPRYIVGFWDDKKHILVCDIELSTPGGEGRTYYGAAAIRIDSDDFIMDLEGAVELEALVRHSSQTH